MKKCTPNRRPLRMKGGVSELTHHLMQRGEPIRVQQAEHPINSRDLTNVFDFGTGRKNRSDAHREVACKCRPQTGAMLQKNKFLNGLKKAPWRRHQSVDPSSMGRCQYVDCPGRKASKAKVPRPYDAYLRCKKCSIVLGKDIFLCNAYKKHISLSPSFP